MQMNKKIVVSLATIAVVGVASVGATYAWFSSRAVSHGNIITAGKIALKIDHTKQVYNGVNCGTCTQETSSSTSDKIVATFLGASDASPVFTPVTPFNAVVVNPYASDWPIIKDSANNDIPWIWAYANPSNGGANANKYQGYRFEKTFNWGGSAVTGGNVTFKFSADNTYKVTLNNVVVTGCTNVPSSADPSIWQNTHTCTLTNIVPGLNTLDIEVINIPNTTHNNPAGLTYNLVINGNCADPDSYFGQHCQLWDLSQWNEQAFYNFDDVKPGDSGLDVISLHTSNDSYACMYAPNMTIVPTNGTLANYIHFYFWDDVNGDGVQDNGELAIGSNPYTLSSLNASLGVISATATAKYIGVKWCFGDFNADYTACNGSGSNDDAQGDSLTTDIGFYAVQKRNNDSFTCPQVWPGQVTAPSPE